MQLMTFVGVFSLNMVYREALPHPILTQHVECFWELTILPQAANRHYEVMAPDCTFDIIFSPLPFTLEFTNKRLSTKINAGAAFLGQKTSSIRFSVKQPQRIFGVRFKPFAFAHLFSIPPTKMNNTALPLARLFDLKGEDCLLIKKLLRERSFGKKTEDGEKLVLRLLRDNLHVDQLFRAQLNYILDRRGQVEIRKLFSEFGISKVTLHKHFVQKMGLSPKAVSRIWRLNYFLDLKKQSSTDNLTQLALESGYYDQAHFIREFKSFFPDSPRQFFKQRSALLSISQDIISKRFSNRYDPVSEHVIASGTL